MQFQLWIDVELEVLSHLKQIRNSHITTGEDKIKLANTQERRKSSVSIPNKSELKVLPLPRQRNESNITTEEGEIKVSIPRMHRKRKVFDAKGVAPSCYGHFSTSFLFFYTSTINESLTQQKRLKNKQRVQEHLRLSMMLLRLIIS